MPIPLGVLAVAGAGAGATGSFDLLETTLISTNTASVTFSNLNNYSDYKHLQIRMTLRSNTSTDVGYLRFNSNTGNNYSNHDLVGNGSGVFSAAWTSQSGMWIRFAGSDDPANAFSSTVVDVLDFGNASKNTTVRQLNGWIATGAGSNFIYLMSGAWLNTNAVTSMTLSNLDSSFVSGSRFSLYGIK